MTDAWAEYVQRVTAGLSQKDIAAATGIDQTGISRWLRGLGMPRAESVVAFARALGRPLLEALVAGGYIEAGDVDGVIEVVPPPSELSDEQLFADMARITDELRRRVQRTEEASAAGTVGSKAQPDAVLANGPAHRGDEPQLAVDGLAVAHLVQRRPLLTAGDHRTLARWSGHI